LDICRLFYIQLFKLIFHRNEYYWLWRTKFGEHVGMTSYLADAREVKKKWAWYAWEVGGTLKLSLQPRDNIRKKNIVI
jgi:hypothetical protein